MASPKEAIQVLRATERRDSLDGPSTPTPAREVPGCVVVPLMQVGEETFAGQIVEADYFVKAPAGSDVLSTDRVRIRGEECEVLGRPADYGRKGLLFQARSVASE